MVGATVVSSLFCHLEEVKNQIESEWSGSVDLTREEEELE